MFVLLNKLELCFFRRVLMRFWNDLLLRDKFIQVYLITLPIEAISKLVQYIYFPSLLFINVTDDVTYSGVYFLDSLVRISGHIIDTLLVVESRR